MVRIRIQPDGSDYFSIHFKNGILVHRSSELPFLSVLRSIQFFSVTDLDIKLIET